MPEKIRYPLLRGVLAALYALSLVLTLLALVGLRQAMGRGCTAALAMVAAAALLRPHRVGRWIYAALIAVGAAGYLLLGGAQTVTDCARAVYLHLSGLQTAVHFVADDLAILWGILAGAAAYELVDPRRSALLSGMVTACMLLAAWFDPTGASLICTAPGLVCVVTQSATGRWQGVRPLRVFTLSLAAVTAAFLLAPAQGVGIQPLQDAAERIRQKIYDYFFFTEPRNVFSLATEGYYPQGMSQLGGPAQPDDEPVMIVSAPRTVYLRGAIRDRYTGRTWVDTTGGRRYLWVSPRWREDRARVFDMALPADPQGMPAAEQITVTMVGAGASSMFVPQRVRSLAPMGDLVPYFNTASEIFATRDLAAGDAYTVSAPLTVAGDAGLDALLAACAQQPDNAYAAVSEKYTALPEHLEQVVWDLAAEITRGADTPYARAMAIRRYLMSTCRYTLDVAPQPETVDFVTNFLLNTKEGYCTYFASAMTVLCRMAGLPARYVEGYLAHPSTDGKAYVTGLNAHAWTEVYFAGFGWLTVDATPSDEPAPPPDAPPDQPDAPPPDEPDATPPPEEPQPSDPPTPTPEPESDAPTPTPTPSAEPDGLPPEDEADPPQPPHSGAWWIWLAILLVLIAAAARIVWTLPAQQARRAKDESARWSVWLQAVHDALRTQGYTRCKHESPTAFLQRVDADGRYPAELTPLGETMALVFYGKLSPEPEETAMAQEAWQALQTCLKWPAKLRLTLMRAFTPVKNRAFTQ